MAILSVAEQVHAMHAAWPNMGLVHQAAWGAGWIGALTPYDRGYRVRVDFYLGLEIGDCDLVNWGPEVRVLAPDLLAECAPGLPPHLYPSDRHATLCLFDPAADDWSFAMPLAATIVPWAAQWLAFYELWRTTGRWTGPERHPDMRSSTRRLAQACTSGDHSAIARPRLRRVREVSAQAGTESSGPMLRAAASGRCPSAAVDWLRGSEMPLPVTAAIGVAPPFLRAPYEAHTRH